MAAQTPASDKQLVKHASIPGPNGLPGLGVALNLNLDWLLETRARYGDVFRLNLPMGKAGVLVAHPDDIESVFTQKHLFEGRSAGQLFERAPVAENPNSSFRQFSGMGLIAATGTDWRKQRQVLQPTFHAQHVEVFAQVMIDQVAETLRRWDAKYGAASTLINLRDEMTHLTLNIIMRIMFSSGVSDSEFPVIAQAMSDALAGISVFTDQPISPFVRAKFKRAVAQLNKIIYRVIEQRRQLPADQRPNDLLTMLLSAPNPESGELMSDTQIRDELMTMVVAGHETTALALTWFWYAVGSNAQIERKLHSELDTVFDQPIPAMQDLPNLPYTNQVIQEVLRHHTIGWMLPQRIAQVDTELGGYSIRAGEMIYISPHVVHHHPAFWPEPQTFDPERFTPDESAKRPRYAYIPFGGGPRICIGYHLAMLELPIVIGGLAKAYRFELDPSRTVKAKPLANVEPAGGLWGTLRRR